MKIIRRQTIYLLTFSLCFTLSSLTFSNAADTPNGKCSTLGKTVLIKGVKYLCSKSGKNQIWIKAIVLSAEDAKLEALYNDIKLKMDRSDPKFDMSINIDPQLSKSSWSKDSVASIGSATKLLQAMGVKTSTPMKIYISWGMEYLDEYLPDYCKFSAGGGSCGQTGIIFADLKWFATSWGYGGTEKPYKSEMDKFTISANLPHEIAHFGHSEVAMAIGNSDYWKYIPPWLREGGAEYFKLLSTAYDRKVTYKSLHDLYLLNGGDRCTNISLSQMTEQDSKTDGCEYGKGLFATEYLVLKTGRADAPFLMNQKTGTDTATIFKSAYGFSLNDFNKEADTYYLKLISGKK
jgi:hypothetical protein